jgi:arylsulfatase A-like enzyme
MNFEMNGVFSPLRIGSVAIREGPYKYVHYFGYPKDYKAVPKLQDSLYDLRTDPGETINLVSTEPAEAARLRAEIEAQVAAHSLPKEVQ